jgi:acyl-CoA thioesterase FadM
MARATLDEQSNYEFSHTLNVRFTDVNMAAHLATDSLVGLLQEARSQALRKLGFSSLDLGAVNVGLVIADLVVNFKREGSIFDTLQIESHFGDFGTRSFRVFHRITRTGELLALAETGMVCFDYARRQPTPIPDPFLVALQNHQNRWRTQNE